MPPQLRQYQPIDFGIRIPQNVFTTPANTNIFYDALDAQNQRTVNDAKVAEVEQAMQLNRELKDIFAPVDGVAPDFESKRQDVMNALARSGQINQVIAMQEADRKRQDLYGDQAAQVISSATRIAPFSPETAISILNNAKAKGVIDPNIPIDEILLKANRYGMMGFDPQGNSRQVVQPIVLPGSGDKAEDDPYTTYYDPKTKETLTLTNREFAAMRKGDPAAAGRWVKGNPYSGETDPIKQALAKALGLDAAPNSILPDVKVGQGSPTSAPTSNIPTGAVGQRGFVNKKGEVANFWVDANGNRLERVK